jgi:predicted DNA-binding transcriptional regulator AlpA
MLYGELMNLPPDFPALADIRETAQGINFSYSHVRKWTYGQKPLPTGWPMPVKIGGAIRYRRDDIERWIAQLSNEGEQQNNAGLECNTPALKRRRGRPRKVSKL